MASSPSLQTAMRLRTPCSSKARSVRSTSIGLSSTNRIGRTDALILAPLADAAAWQLKIEAGAGIRPGIRPRLPAQFLHHLPDDGQSQASAFEVFLADQPVEQ